MNARRLAGFSLVFALVVGLGWSGAVRRGTADRPIAPPAARAQAGSSGPIQVPGPEEHPPELVKLAAEFRAIRESSSAGLPDYAGEAARQKEAVPGFRRRLEALDTAGWSVHSQIDYLLLRSEMDALEFNLRVWRPTSRNPSFYVNQAIANVGRHLTGNRRFRGEAMPYGRLRAQAILQGLTDTGKVLAQARTNLTEMVPALADVALRHPGGGYYTEGGELKYIARHYETWARRTAEFFPEG